MHLRLSVVLLFYVFFFFFLPLHLTHHAFVDSCPTVSSFIMRFGTINPEDSDY